jgi:hypothetical protein
MDKEEIKREIEYLKDKRGGYGWREGDAEKFEQLQRQWERCMHLDRNGKQVKAPEI